MEFINKTDACSYPDAYQSKELLIHDTNETVSSQLILCMKSALISIYWGILIYIKGSSRKTVVARLTAGQHVDRSILQLGHDAYRGSPLQTIKPYNAKSWPKTIFISFSDFKRINIP